MTERHSVTRILVGHFFRRFFDNDTTQVDGDTQTTVVRAISIVAAPGLLVSFFLQNTYPKPLWSAIVDQYFFVLLSFVALGAVSIFEWEMLFPDRLDFLVLSQLSVKPVQMLVAKVLALCGFLSLFLVACNLFAMVILPAISRGDFFRQLYAHAAAVLLAGLFASLFFLALAGVMLCVLNEAQFRRASPVVQMVSVTVLVLLALHCVKYGDSIPILLSSEVGIARWIPPLWFLGVYQVLLHGEAAPAFAQPLARYAVWGTAASAILVLLTYPMAWARMRRAAIEGSTRKRGVPSRLLTGMTDQIVRRPGERALFHFIGQTIARNNRYQIFLAIYCGTGLALAVGCGVTLHSAGGRLRPMLSETGLHAVIPLLLFWVIAGLRAAFAFPQNLSAGWVFRVTGVDLSQCATAERRWVLLCGFAVLGGILAALCWAGWDLRHLIVQAACGICLCVLLTDAFFFSQQSVPFNRPRMPGRTGFPLLVTLYVGIVPLLVYAVIILERQMEKNLSKLVLLALATTAIRTGLSKLRSGPEIPEEVEGYEGEFQLLGLSK